MPHVDEMLDQIGKANYVSTLDLAKGYWQVPMAMERKQVSVALRLDCATFQRMMDHNL